MISEKNRSVSSIGFIPLAAPFGRLVRLILEKFFATDYKVRVKSNFDEQVLPLVPPDEGGSPYAGQVCIFLFVCLFHL